MHQKKQQILVATRDFPGILVISELFALGYSPNDIKVVSLEPDDLFDAFCQSKNLKINRELDKYQCDILLSVNFQKLIPIDIINCVKVGAINLHPAITQKYRGCWGTSWSIINNESITGYTWHYMDERFDTGDIVYQEYIDILPSDTAHSLYYKIYRSAFNNLKFVIDFAGKPGIKQETVGTYYNRKIPYDGKIDPTWNHDQVDRFKRAMYFPPYK